MRCEYAGKGWWTSMVQSNRLRLHALAGSAKDVDINQKKYQVNKYTHFDNRVSIHKVIDNIRNPDWVVKHSFFPFIHFEMKFAKYSRLECEVKNKTRHIYYASHLDSYIYKYYGDLFNNVYNNIAHEFHINSAVIAYRNNMKGKSNIHFTKEVIDFIKSHNQAFIYVADFTKFFDNIDHEYLRKQLEFILGVKRLPEDIYCIFKNNTKYSWVNRENIEKVLKKKYKTKNRIKKATKYRYFNAKDFRRFRKANKNNVESNKESYGIPQGAGVSAVFSNIYLLDFDRVLNNYIKKHNGIYRRYCDDLIIVVPFEGMINKDNYNHHIEFIESIRKSIPRLKIQEEKTDIYFYNNDRILDKLLNPSKLDYLGFSFDGQDVRIREKSLFKFYNRAYKHVSICNHNTVKYGRKKNRIKLYKRYTHLGKLGSGYGNFLSYASRAEKVFNKNSITNNFMEAQVKNHWKYINKRLKS